MALLSIWAQLEAKPGKEKEVEEFLKSAQALAEREPSDAAPAMHVSYGRKPDWLSYLVRPLCASSH